MQCWRCCATWPTTPRTPALCWFHWSCMALGASTALLVVLDLLMLLPQVVTVYQLLTDLLLLLLGQDQWVPCQQVHKQQVLPKEPQQRSAAGQRTPHVLHLPPLQAASHSLRCTYCVV